MLNEFTGKERDSESGLDYFGARYYGSALGRFTSADEPLEDQHPDDPQSWNLYAYVRNSPVRFTDADGKKCKNGKNESGDACFDTTVYSFSDIAIGAGKSIYNDLAYLASLYFYYENESFKGYTNQNFTTAAQLPQAQYNNAGQQKGTNPFGKRGGLLHQAKTAEVEAAIESRGLKADANGNIVEMHQIGRATVGNQPVARERQALNDIQNATGQRPEFHAYNK